MCDASTYEIAIYDKVKELEQGSMNGTCSGAETDYDCQHNLFAGKKMPEVLRLEVSLKSRKAKSLLKTLGIQCDMTLKALFCTSLSHAVLIHY